MEKIKIYIFGMLAVGIVTMVSFSSCDRQDDPYLIGKHRFNQEEEDDEAGISFVMESDSLEDEIEEIYFEASDWDEEGMDVDL